MTTTTMLHRLRGANNEGVLLGVIILLLVLMAIVQPGALTWGFAGDIVRSGLVNLILAMGVLMVIIAGGIDVSFMAIAIFSGYATVQLMLALGLDGMWWPWLVAGGTGALLAIPNVILVAGFRVPTLMATLGTMTIIRGALLAFVGSSYTAVLPDGLNDLGQMSLFRLGTSPVSVLLIPVLLICVAIAALLSKTYYGRSIYAIGGDAEAAERAGVPVFRVTSAVFLISGFIAGIAGLVHITINRTANPFDLVGGELDVIAAVVIGGAVDTGGRGSVRGTILGVLLISIVRNSLIRLGVPSFWHVFAVGAVVLIGVSVQAISNRSRGLRTPILEAVQHG